MNTDPNLLLTFAKARQADARQQIEAEHLIQQAKGTTAKPRREQAARQFPALWKKAIRLSVPRLAQVSEG